MSTSLSRFPERCGGSFQQIVAAFLGDDGLPFADILTDEWITRVYAKHAALIGFSGVYSTAMILWAFLSQVLQDGKGAACRAESCSRRVSACSEGPNGNGFDLSVETFIVPPRIRSARPVPVRSKYSADPQSPSRIEIAACSEFRFSRRCGFEQRAFTVRSPSRA